jgi:uncharacterized protein
VDISFDPAKRAKTLVERGIDFADALRVFGGLSVTVQDERLDYGEIATSRSAISPAVVS